MRRIDAFLSKQSRLWIICASWLITALIVSADLLTGVQVALHFFYLVPVFIITWYAGRWMGAILSVAIAFVWFGESLTNPQFIGPAVAFWNNSVGLGFFWLAVRLIGLLRHVLDRERVLARTDALTGALNWRAFTEVANNEIERSRRYLHPFTVAYFDVDDFKKINDQFGHTVGDAVLQSIVNTTCKTLRINDNIARLGGDEFAILLPETDLDAAQIVLKRVQQQICDAMEHRQWPITCSIGAVTYHSPPETIDQMLQEADRVMYSVKQTTKNQIATLVIERKHATLEQSLISSQTP
ncbi:MAG TPA: GGDEF domain-containing protein [Roseiflexaceae bacterium]|jgi:diguanylate cyclase (GGDEF)-like protein|nr:GGDEF domain-containing protein [Roseiflexaceae bacterium]